MTPSGRLGTLGLTSIMREARRLSLRSLPSLGVDHDVTCRTHLRLPRERRSRPYGVLILILSAISGLWACAASSPSGTCDTQSGSCGELPCTPPTCADPDPCATDNGGCGDPTYYACTNTEGAPPTCSDIDECATDNGGCGDPADFACTNNEGAPPTCSDIDECATDNGGCGLPEFYSCANQPGPGVVCSCIRWQLPATPSAFDLHVPANGLIGEELRFSVTERASGPPLADYDLLWQVDAAPDPEPGYTTAVVTHTYSTPSRYEVVVTLTNRNDPGDLIHLVGYVDVSRPYAQTIYPLRGTAFGPQETKSFGVPNWCGFDYEVYYGKYFEFWNQQGVDTSREYILQTLTVLDALFEVNGEVFGWDYPVNPGPRYTVCEDVGGAGSGPVGIFVSSSLAAGGAAFRRKHLGTLVHESIHLWDFRGELHTQGPDTAHVLTGAMEGYIQRLRDWGTIGAYNDSIIETGGQTFERMATAHFLARYLGDPSASWDTYFNATLLSMSHGEIAASVDIPEAQERIYVQSGFLSAIRDMHGPEALRAYFQQLDLLLVENPSWASMTLSSEQRLDNFFVALARALQTDVSPYFDDWKIPITEAQRTYAAQFPSSRMLSDGDGDGFTPLEGDIDDCDATIYPNGPELLDGLDNNQDGQTDERVYDENDLGDLDSVSIELPARIVGDIPSQADTDELRFTAPTDTIVAIVVHPGQAHTPAPYAPGDTRLSRVYLGTVAVGSWHLLSNPPWMSGVSLPINYRSTGDEIVVRLDALDRVDANGVPGRYELQIAPEGHASAPWDVETLLQEIFPN